MNKTLAANRRGGLSWPGNEYKEWENYATERTPRGGGEGGSNQCEIIFAREAETTVADSSGREMTAGSGSRNITAATKEWLWSRQQDIPQAMSPVGFSWPHSIGAFSFAAA